MLRRCNYLTQFKKELFFAVFLLLFVRFDIFSQTPVATRRVDTIMFNNFFYKQNKLDTVRIENKFDFFNYFTIINCISGTLYFSGNGFSGIVTIQYKGNASELKKYFERCISGSKFTLDNCAFERDGGLKPIYLNKTVVFQ